MEHLTKRQLSILNLFINNKHSLSSEFLSKNIGVSSKTILKDISSINTVIKSYGAHLISKTGIGHTLAINNQNSFNDFLLKFKEYTKDKNSVPHNYQRFHYIIRKFLLSDGYIKINDLAEELYISRTTIASDMYYVRSILREYDIKVIQRPNYGIKISGTEHHKRLCIVDEYQNFLSCNLYVSEDEYDELLFIPEADLELLKNIIFEAQGKFTSIDISYQNINKIIRLISICNKRNEFTFEECYSPTDIYEVKSGLSYSISKYILKQCKDKLNYIFGRQDAILLCIFLASCRSFISIDSINNKEIFTKYFTISEELIDYLCELYDLETLFADNDLRLDLAFHFIAMMKRVKYKVKIDHIPNNLVKQNSPTSIELAVQSSIYLERKYNISLNEDEVCHLAMIFFPIFGRYNTNINKRNIIIISNISKTIGKTIAERFYRNFQHYINKISIFELYEIHNTNLSGYDLIFTDVPEKLLEKYSIPVVHIDTFFKDSTKKHVRNILTHGNDDFSNIQKYFLKDLFFSNISVHNKKELFEFISNQIIDKYNLFSGVLEDFIKREEICSAETGKNVAIMKTLTSYCKESFISVIALDKPIVWKYEHVQMVVIWHKGINDLENSKIFESGYMGNILRSIFGVSERLVNLLQNPTHETLISIIKDNIGNTTN